ncbi:hypothetical protein GCM10011492_05910 [Flexivirga endophytica]|uniref:DNA (cytosine-5-)-methyltransferase n=2 Tax=Flexivirga endophytica TaxID=1849103 RepID=A0A916WQ24_9MICO|nr:hypothetical protein GCM10011492_05910 [Flexivirga endophytica]GHB36799.1 hypothetical protein GCM10008112_01690 [Flexivirga endophytica]
MGYMDVVEALHPRAVIMENVPDMGLSDDFRVLRTIEAKLEGLGYAVEYQIVEAWRYGVPQHRRRLILLARRDGGGFAWPKQTGRVSLMEAIGDLPELVVEPREAIGARVMSYDKRPVGKFQKIMRTSVGSELHDHWTRRVRLDDYQVFLSMTPETLYSDIPADQRRYTADTFTDKYKRLDPEGLSRTITAHIAKDGYWYIHPTQPRTLTVREAARVQTFPDSFRFAGTRSDAFRQIGNAVPPRLAQAAAITVRPVEDSEASSLESRRWADIREAIDGWATAIPRSDGRRSHLAGVGVRPLRHLVVVLLGAQGHGRAATNLYQLADGPLDKKRYAALVGAAKGRARDRLQSQLEQLVDRGNLNDIQAVSDGANLTSSQAKLYGVLRGEDGLLAGAAALRVATRLHGMDPSTAANTHTDGKARLARLVGAGEGAMRRMTAVRLIGSTICLKDPLCGECPLSKFCPTFTNAPQHRS